MSTNCCANPAECGVLPKPPTGEVKMDLPTSGEEHKVADATNGIGSKAICCEGEVCSPDSDVEKCASGAGTAANGEKCKGGCNCGVSCCCVPAQDEALDEAAYVPLPPTPSVKTSTTTSASVDLKSPVDKKEE